MAHNTSKAGFPDIPLTAGMKLRLEARDPTTNAAISGVSASQWTIFGWQTTVSELAPDGTVLYQPASAPEV